MNRLKLLAIPAALVLLAGCSPFGKKSEEYKGAQARAAAPLEVPPELTAPTMDDRYSIPDPRAQTAYSAYSQKPAAGSAAPRNPRSCLNSTACGSSASGTSAGSW
jgi:Uncharacterized lipoprotein